MQLYLLHFAREEHAKELPVLCQKKLPKPLKLMTENSEEQEAGVTGLCMEQDYW